MYIWIIPIGMLLPIGMIFSAEEAIIQIDEKGYILFFK